jgi:uncharacterized protein (TIGR00255 family)
MLSMTGYGQAQAESDDFRVEVTLRSVNHRFLDLVIRLPEICRQSETSVQRVLSSRLSRGRVEMSAEAVSLHSLEPEVRVSEQAAAALSTAVARLAEQGIVAGELRPADLLRVPGVLDVRSRQDGWTSEDEDLLLQAVDVALSQLLESRREEGGRLALVVGEKLVALDGYVARLVELRPAVQEALEVAWRSRLEDALVDGEVDSERVSLELALLIDKTNISEELERLLVHLAHFREILEQESPVGKRLDFLVQEIFRELNTLSSKCRDTQMTRVCVDSKVLCEELREQLRNVE